MNQAIPTSEQVNDYQRVLNEKMLTVTCVKTQDGLLMDSCWMMMGKFLLSNIQGHALNVQCYQWGITMSDYNHYDDYDWRKLYGKFDTYNDLVGYMVHHMVDDEGRADFIAKKAMELHHEISKPPNPTHRAPHKLAVECFYITTNALGAPISRRATSELSDKLFGQKTRPEPHQWCYPYTKMICEVLICDPADLPFRGPQDATMEGVSNSDTPTE